MIIPLSGWMIVRVYQVTTDIHGHPTVMTLIVSVELTRITVIKTYRRKCIVFTKDSRSDEYTTHTVEYSLPGMKVLDTTTIEESNTKSDFITVYTIREGKRTVEHKPREDEWMKPREDEWMKRLHTPTQQEYIVEMSRILGIDVLSKRDRKRMRNYIAEQNTPHSKTEWQLCKPLAKYQYHQ